MITPAVSTFTVPFVTAILCAVPGVNVVPAIDCTLKVSPSMSVSLVTRFSAVVPSSATVKVLSSTATGPSLTAVISKDALPVVIVEPSPSLML